MVTRDGRIGALDFSIKVASRCNLNCTYCYVYNKADTMWIDRPSIMPDETFFKSIDRIKEHCLLSGQKSVEITFHGGEPFLVGPKRMGRWCEHAKRVLGGTVDVHFTVQTNSTLVNDAWI